MHLGKILVASSLLVLAVALFCVSASAQEPPAWEQVAGSGPTARYDHAIAYNSKLDIVIIQGGTLGSGGELSDHWEWNGSKWEKKAFSGGSPYSRTESAMAYDSKRDISVLFGGWRSGWGNPYRSDTWVYDGKAWKEKDISGPSGRSKHAMAYYAKKKLVILYGGYDGNNRLGDTWAFNGKSWKKLTEKGPGPLVNHAMAYDAKRKVVVLFGGYSNSGYFDETWTLKGKKWKRRSTSGPEARTDHGMAFDSSSNTVIMFGGKKGDWPDYVYLGDTWAWNGKKWEELNSDSPSARMAHGMVCHDKLKKVFLFGGKPGAWQALGDTWLFSK